MLMFYLIVTKWLILGEQKVNEILCSDWLPKQARWACCLPYSGFPALVLQEKKFSWPCNYTTCRQRKTGYKPWKLN